ncbi:MAG: hypothetical protein ACXW3P_11740 [Rhodospirillales bacterium]
MKKKFAFVISFIALLFVADRILAEALFQVVMKSNLRLSMAYDGRAEADVVIIGNSRGVHMASSQEWAQVLCRPVFNLSLNGLDVISQDALVRDFLERNPPPKIMVFEISNLFVDEMITPQLRPFMSGSDRLAALVRSNQTTVFPWLDISHLYRFNSELLLRALLFLLRPSDQTPEAIGSISPARIDVYLSRRPRFDVNPQAVPVLASTLEALKAHGVEPVLVLAPYHPEAFRISDWRAEALAEVRAGLPAGVPIQDWSLALPDDASFADPLHMSPAGRHALAGQLALFGLGQFASLCPATAAQVMPAEP